MVELSARWKNDLKPRLVVSENNDVKALAFPSVNPRRKAQKNLDPWG